MTQPTPLTLVMLKRAQWLLEISWKAVCSNPTIICHSLKNLHSDSFQTGCASSMEFKIIECVAIWTWGLSLQLMHLGVFTTNLWHNTLPTAEILNGKNARAFLFCGFLMKSFKKYILKIWKKLWEPFGSYLLNSRANSAIFHPNLAKLAVLSSR